MRREQLYQIKTKRRKFKTGRLIFLLVLCGFLATVLFSVRFLGVLNSLHDTSAWANALPEPLAGKREHVLLFSVSDREIKGIVTDIALVAYHPVKKDARVIHLPINTLVDIENRVHLRQIYAEGGNELLVNTVAGFIGVPIHYYLEIDEDYLPVAVDLLGGAALPMEMTIGNGGDILSIIHAVGLSPAERLERRRAVLAAVGKRIIEGNFFQRLRYLNKVSPLISTNLSWRKLLHTLDELEDVNFMETNSVIFLPGTEQIQAEGSYWQANPEQLTLLGTWLSEDVSSIPRSQITVEVLNGCGIKGIAKTVSDKLSDLGFNVVRIENADNYNYEVSHVISRISNMDAAKDVAILIPGSQLLKEELTQATAIVTVIIGKNYPRE